MTESLATISGFSAPKAPYTTRRRRFPTRRLTRRVLTYIVLIAVCALTILPAYWMLVTSLRTEAEALSFPPSFFPDHPLVWSNYSNALTEVPYLRYFLNSILIAGANVAGVTLSSIIVAYGFAKIAWRGRNIVFSLVLFTLFLPDAATLVPQYIIFHYIGWVGTFLPLIVPLCFGSPIAIFVLRQFFRRIPEELSNAAWVDGANHWKILWHVIVPLSKPVIVVVAILTFTTSWNNFLTPLIYLTNPSDYTLAVGLYAYSNSHLTQYTLMMAAAVIFVIPMALVFLWGQRPLLTGDIAGSGLKG